MNIFDIPEYNTPAYWTWVKKLTPELFAQFLRQRGDDAELDYICRRFDQLGVDNWRQPATQMYILAVERLHKGEFAIVNLPHLDDDMQWLQTAGDASRRINYLISRGNYWPLWEEQNAMFIDHTKIPPHKRKPVRIAAQDIDTPSKLFPQKDHSTTAQNTQSQPKALPTGALGGHQLNINGERYHTHITPQAPDWLREKVTRAHNTLQPIFIKDDGTIVAGSLAQQLLADPAARAAYQQFRRDAWRLEHFNPEHLSLAADAFNGVILTPASFGVVPSDRVVSMPVGDVIPADQATLGDYNIVANFRLQENAVKELVSYTLINANNGRHDYIVGPENLATVLGMPNAFQIVAGNFYGVTGHPSPAAIEFAKMGRQDFWTSYSKGYQAGLKDPNTWLNTILSIPVGGTIPKPNVKPTGKTPAPQFNTVGKIRNGEQSSCTVANSICVAEPINMATGEELYQTTDFELPGPLPLSWCRTYRSGVSGDHGLGANWRSLVTCRITTADDHIQYEDAEGRHIHFPLDQATHTNTLENITLSWDTHNRACISGLTGADRIFTWHAKPTCHLLAELRSGVNAIVFQRNAQGHLTHIVCSWGVALNVDSDAQGHILGVAYADEKTPKPLMRYVFDEQHGDLAAAFDAMDLAECYRYNNHIITTRTLKTGYTYSFDWDQFDQHGQCFATHSDQGYYDYRLLYAADSSDHIDSLGNVTQNQFNAQSQITLQIDPFGGTTKTTYDEHGHAIATLQPDGGRTETVYQQNGQRTAQRDENGAHHAIEYDQDGQPCRYIDPLGFVTTQTYNAAGYPIGWRDALGHLFQRLRNAVGQISALIDPLGQRYDFQYDAQWRLMCIINPEQQAIQLHYQRHLIIRIDFAEGASVAIAYNASDAITQITEPDGREHQFEYAAIGFISRYTQPNGVSKQFIYSHFAQLDAVIDGKGQRKRYLYDLERNLKALINANNAQWTYERDSNHNIIKQTSFDGRTQQHEWDARNRLFATLDADGSRISYYRDLCGNLTEKSDQKTVEKYAYDLCQRLTQANNKHRRVTRTYDPVGNLIQEKQGKYKLEHTYDSVRRRIETGFMGHRIRFEFNTVDQLSAIYFDKQLIIQIERDNRGRVIKQTQGTTSTQQQYDICSRLTQTRITRNDRDKVLLQTDYQYGLASEIKRIIELEQTIDYDFDENQRVICEHRISRMRHSTIDYLFDPVGNPVEEYSGRSCKDSRVIAYRDQRNTYDKRGNVIGITKLLDYTSLHCQYNAFNRLVSVNRNGVLLAEYIYDALGRRICKITPQHTTHYIWNEDVLMAEIREQNGVTIETFYLYEPNTFKPIAMIRNGQIYHYHLNHIDAVKAMTDATGEIVWSADYDAFGQRISGIKKIENNLRFQGQYYDAETGLYYSRYRYFDPHTGRYTQHDPLGLDGGDTLYQYGPNMLHWIDPYGLIHCNDLPGGPEKFSETIAGRFGLQDADEAATLLKEIVSPNGIRYKHQQHFVSSEVTQVVKKGNTFQVTVKTNAKNPVETTVPLGDFVSGWKAKNTWKGGKVPDSPKFGPKPGEPEPNWGNLLKKYIGYPPKKMINPHAHHTVFKMGRGKKMREYLDQSKEILEKHNIDWFKGPENLGWAPNKNHSTKAVKAVRDALQKADIEVGTREAIINTLKDLGTRFSDDTIKTLF